MTVGKYTLLILATFCLALGNGCISNRRANDAAVEKLRKRLVSERFDEIYKDSSTVTRAQPSQDEFVAKMQAVTNALKKIDSDINWKRDETYSYDPGVFRDDNFSSRDLNGNGLKVNVQLEWAPDFRLCSMHVFTDLNDSKGVGFRNCD